MKKDKKITLSIKCQNIAPINNLSKDIQSDSLKIGIFADNGSGKTFISRLFRLTENRENPSEQDETFPTDELLSFGQDNGKFEISVKGKDGEIKDDFQITINRGKFPSIPKTKYLYHTFNQDYVKDNIKNYEKDSEIEGFILGKINIDLNEEEKELEKIEKEKRESIDQIKEGIDKHVKEKTSSIEGIARFNKYKDLNYQKVSEGIDKEKLPVSKTTEELIADYNKVKSAPENLSDIQPIERVNFDSDLLKKIRDSIEEKYSLSSFAEEFKQKVKNEQPFIERGVKLQKENAKICPFCKQELKNDALRLIEEYTKYLEDTESEKIKLFKGYAEKLDKYIDDLHGLENNNTDRINSFNEYKAKYIPSRGGVELQKIQSEQLIKNIQAVIEKIKEKVKDISKSIVVEEELISKIKEYQDLIDETVAESNREIEDMNSRKNKISEEMKYTKEKICESIHNDLVDKYRDKIKDINSKDESINKLKEEIKKKREQEKISKKSEVASTITKVLNYFFYGKYTFDKETFRLKFHEKALETGQAKNVLSEGEKNIIAFAYYMGDSHLKIENESDYERLFFIIDDPISSMDFSHVYTLCKVVKDIKKIIIKLSKELSKERFIIFTHNNDFMRIITSSEIINKTLLLKNSEIKGFNTKFTVPYISHLLDIYNIAKNHGSPNHTTANSIRHIIETLTYFQNILTSTNSIRSYIETNFPNDKNLYLAIQDLSHGAWRSEQAPIHPDRYVNICKAIIDHIEKKYKGQIDYCKTVCDNQILGENYN
ncbi:MAG: AAA family ATPase [Endomicrobium sp.]|nr:AAA family ATPase [Endomicrobium sp.]